MTDQNRKADIVAMTRIFRRLSLRKRRNLAWHAKQETGICCGVNATLFNIHNDFG